MELLNKKVKAFIVVNKDGDNLIEKIKNDPFAYILNEGNFSMHFNEEARNLKKDKIIQYIDRLRADTRRLTSESISKEVEKLDEVYRDACTKKQYSAAVNAIRLKSQLLGFLVEKKEVQHSTLDAMSDDDMAKYLDQIKQENDLN
jgi:hypothetical protein